jgi:hypothetical protein
VNAAITYRPAAEVGSVNSAEDSFSITVQLFGSIAVKELRTSFKHEYQAMDTDGAGVPVTVAVAKISEPTCLVPSALGVEENTGAEVTAAVEALNMSVNTLPCPLTTAVALTLATMNFPSSTSRTRYVALVCPFGEQSELNVELASLFSDKQVNQR